MRMDGFFREPPTIGSKGTSDGGWMILGVEALKTPRNMEDEPWLGNRVEISWKYPKFEVEDMLGIKIFFSGRNHLGLWIVR